MTAPRTRRPAARRTGYTATTDAPTPLLRGALYLRISDDREGQELGVQRQEDDLRALFERLGIEVIAIYADNDIGASTRSKKPRPDYTRMLADARSGQFAVIGAYTSSRLTRRPSEHEGQIELAEQVGTTYRFVRSPEFDLNTANGRMIARFLAAKDANEAEETSERVIRQKQQKRAAGGRLGGNRPFGYERDGVTVRAQEATLTDRGLDTVLSGGSLGSIARDWDQQCPRSEWTGTMLTRLAASDPATVSEADAALLADVRRRVAAQPPAEHLVDDLGDKHTAAWAAGDLTERQVPNGRAWTGQTVRLILTNLRNAGIMEDADGTVITAQWPAITTEEKVRAVRAIVADAARGRESNSMKWIGPRLYRCGVAGCDSDMRNSGTSQFGGRNVTLYRCRAHGHLSIPAAEVDEFVRESAVAILRRDGAALLAKPVESVDMSALRIQANTLRARLTEARNSYADLKTSEADWFAIRDRITPNLAKIERQLATVVTRSALTGVADAPDPGAAFLACGPDRQRSMIGEMMTITILPGKRGRSANGVDLLRVAIRERNAPRADLAA